MKYIAYHKKEPIILNVKENGGMILTRFECGNDIFPNPNDNEDYIEIESEKEHADKNQVF